MQAPRLLIALGLGAAALVFAGAAAAGVIVGVNDDAAKDPAVVGVVLPDDGR